MRSSFLSNTTPLSSQSGEEEEAGRILFFRRTTWPHGVFVLRGNHESFSPEIGKTIKLQDGIGGTIISVDETHIYLDCNHPLAGKDVVFDIRVVGIE